MKRSGQARLVYVKNGNHSIPATWRWARGDARRGKDSHTRQKHIEWLYINISITERDLLLYKRSKHREGMTVIRDQSTEKEWLSYGTKAQRRNDCYKRAKLRQEMTVIRDQAKERITVIRDQSTEKEWLLYGTKALRRNDCYTGPKHREGMTVIRDQSTDRERLLYGTKHREGTTVIREQNSDRKWLLYGTKHREGMTVIGDQSTEREWLLYGTKAQRRNDFHKRAKLRREVTLAIGDKHTGRELLLYERPKHREEMTVTRERSSEMKWPLYETKTQRGNDCYMRLKPRDEMTNIWD